MEQVEYKFTEEANNTVYQLVKVLVGASCEYETSVILQPEEDKTKSKLVVRTATNDTTRWS